MRSVLLVASLLAGACLAAEPRVEASQRLDPGSLELFDLSNATGPLVSRSVSFENPTGAPGAGGTVAGPLGVGRKGAPARMIASGETVTLMDVTGPGTIRHVWLTTAPLAAVMRSTVVRAYWDGQEHPSIEAPLGDLFGFAHGRIVPYQSAVHSVGIKGALNLWLPMPFTKSARIELTNESGGSIPLFFQIDYTLGDVHAADVGRLHVLFRRENPTTLGRDFELLPRRTGKGRFLGTVIGVRSLGPLWWGEGEMKAYLDGDTEFPTIVGTGAEDYVGLSWGMQATPFLYHGASLNDSGFVSMYRWHVVDPIYWSRDIRITIQQIGYDGSPMDPATYLSSLVERSDDWSCASFWYEPVPSAPLPPPADTATRTADLEPEPAPPR